MQKQFSIQHEVAVWSSGMILALGARGPGFNSPNGPTFFIAMKQSYNVKP